MLLGCLTPGGISLQTALPPSSRPAAALMIPPEALAAESERAQLLRLCIELGGRVEFVVVDECR